MIRRLAFLSLAALALVSCATDQQGLNEEQTPRSRYYSEVGASPVGVIPEAVLRDDTRGRDVVMTIEYPTRPGTYPLVIFSHAGGATNRTYVGLSAYWASQGYVVVKPRHADAARGTSNQEMLTAAEWRDRVQDVRFILDSLARLEEVYPELQGKVDRANVGVGGHGYGAVTALRIGGVGGEPGAPGHADPRVKAIVAMSPPGPGESRGLTTGSFTELRVPTLFMTGTRDQGMTESETPEWRRQAFELAPAGDKWLVVIEGASSGSFAGQMATFTPDPQRPVDPMRRDPLDPTYYPRTDPRQPGRESTAGLRHRGISNAIENISLAFWDTYLRNDAAGRTALEAAGARGGIELQRK